MLFSKTEFLIYWYFLKYCSISSFWNKWVVFLKFVIRYTKLSKLVL